ncbi:uncharacterized protein LOC9659991 [Selaginella moellendorffii]|uniref:uncharacterized protein LOC9659991 n=1 Tax=Selaginella moellendorffii TaxID=88036 RepID=UPI000D1CC706|nr:uncharacterized protein LOC9659991 [Selaginella moellendorffii]|eukprot:XP_024520477.1 uncharacterized protein LOC9659991 [Selaginella moellendorffii]
MHRIQPRATLFPRLLRSAWKGHCGLLSKNRHGTRELSKSLVAINEMVRFQVFGESNATNCGGKRQAHDKLPTNHRRWWRAQALRYLTRFPSEYLCNLLNKERHRAFGEEVAKLVLKTLGTEWPHTRNESKRNSSNPMEEHVWSDYGPWMPRPLLSIHVRQGDKASEMRVVSFDEYMKLANVLRKKCPHVRNVWLSTEMQNVVDESKEYKGWKFYYSDVPRQVGTIRMVEYMALQASVRHGLYKLGHGSRV